MRCAAQLTPDTRCRSYAVPYITEHGSTGHIVAWMPIAPVGISPDWELPMDVKDRVNVAVYCSFDVPFFDVGSLLPVKRK